MFWIICLLRSPLSRTMVVALLPPNQRPLYHTLIENASTFFNSSYVNRSVLLSALLKYLVNFI
jgi:hypothetical protein